MFKDSWKIDKKDYPNNGTFEDKVKFLLQYAILAPSGHNSQPWKFKIHPNKLEIMPDYDRGRNIVDSDNRELFVSLGAVAKNFEVAANYFGLGCERVVKNDSIEFELNPDKEIEKDSDLFKAILTRSTYREDYLDKKLGENGKHKLKMIKSDGVDVLFYDDSKSKNLISRIAVEADLVWHKSRHLIKELEEWLRDDVELAKDGLPTGMINMYKIAAEAKYLFSKDSRIAKEKANKDKIRTETAALFLLITTEQNEIDDWIEAGMTYEETMLKITSMGLTNGILGSLTELKGMRRKLAKELRISGYIQLAISAGYPKIKVAKTPRRPIDEMLV